MLASILLLTFLAWKTNWHQVAESFVNLRLGLWLLGVALYFATQLVSSIRWMLLARPLGFGQPWRQMVGFYFIGMFFNLVLPTSVGGEWRWAQ